MALRQERARLETLVSAAKMQVAAVITARSPRSSPSAPPSAPQQPRPPSAPLPQSTPALQQCGAAAQLQAQAASVLSSHPTGLHQQQQKEEEATEEEGEEEHDKEDLEEDTPPWEESEGERSLRELSWHRDPREAQGKERVDGHQSSRVRADSNAADDDAAAELAFPQAVMSQTRRPTGVAHQPTHSEQALAGISGLRVGGGRGFGARNPGAVSLSQPVHDGEAVTMAQGIPETERQGELQRATLGCEQPKRQQERHRPNQSPAAANEHSSHAIWCLEEAVPVPAAPPAPSVLQGDHAASSRTPLHALVCVELHGWLLRVSLCRCCAAIAE